jgi:endonuclease-8
MEIGPALLDQRAMAGVGNVYKSEVLFLERLSPFAAVRNVPADVLRRLVERSRELLLANRATFRRTTTSGATLAAGSRLWVYGRNGRPCFRCRTRIEARLQGSDLPRRTFWCPACQRLPASGE